MSPAARAPLPDRGAAAAGAGAAAASAGVPPDRIDGAQLRALLKTIFRVRTRSRPRLGRGGKPRGLIFQIAVYAVMGALAGLLAFIPVDVFTFAMVMGGLTLFVAGMTMVAESGELLFSVQEHDILGHRPVGPRTLLLSRALALFALTLTLTFSLNLVPLALGLHATGAQPWFPLAHFTAITLLSLFCSGVVVFVYVLLTRLVGRERFDSFASWLQLGVSVTFILGYQIIPRMIDRAHGFHVAPEAPWLALLPPAWFAALETLLNGAVPEHTVVRLLPMAATGLAATVAVAVAAVYWLAGDYARRVSALSETPLKPVRERVLVAASLRGRSGLFARLLGSWMPDPVERAAFGLAAAYMRRDRDIRMRLYPSLASYLVFPLLAIIDPRKGSFAPVMTMVMAGMLTASTMMTLKVSAQFAASDVFHYAPLAGTASLFHGVRKAALLFMTVPVVLISSAILIFAVHDRDWLIAIVPALVLMPTLSLVEGLAGDYLPLSLPPAAGRQSGILIGLYLVSAVLVGGLSVLGWFARRHGWFVPLLGVEVVLVVMLHVLLLRGIRARPLAPLV